MTDGMTEASRLSDVDVAVRERAVLRAEMAAYQAVLDVLDEHEEALFGYAEDLADPLVDRLATLLAARKVLLGKYERTIIEPAR